MIVLMFDGLGTPCLVLRLSDKTELSYLFKQHKLPAVGSLVTIVFTFLCTFFYW